MSVQPYIFDPSKGETPESVARKRMFAAQILGRAPGRITNLGEGIGSALMSLGDGIQAYDMNQKADAAEAAGQKQAGELQQQFMRYFTGGADPSGTAAPAAGAPAGFSEQPQAGEGALPGLAEARSRYAEELKDPAMAARFAGMIQAEVGGQGPLAQQAFAESLLNRANARGQSLSDVMSGSYFPAITHQRAAQYAANPQLAQRYQQMMASVLGGSNVSNYATGNASGTVGFNGGPQVSAFGGERFGIEGPDMAWAKRMRGGMGAQVASADPTFMPATGPGTDPLPTRPGAPPEPQPAIQPAPQPPQQMSQAPNPTPSPAPAVPQQPPQQAALPAAPQRDLTPLVQAATNPWVPEEMRAVAQSMLRQEMQRRQQATDPAYQADLAYKQAQTEAMQRKAQGKDATFGLNPQYGVDANGNPVLLQLGNDGTVRQSQMPGGVTLSNKPIQLDAGTHYVLLDPVTRQPVGQVPKNLAGAEAQKVQGKAQGEAAVSLPSDIANADQTVQQIDQLLKNPGLSDIVGPLDQFRPSWSMGSEGRDALARFDQLQGRAFLQAYGALRGGGAITEVEGAKAQSAMARMNRAQSEDDFKQALTDFRDAVQTGLAKMREKAGGASAPPAPQAQAQPSGAPAVGTVQQGYRFKGGNPSDPSSWEKVN